MLDFAASAAGTLVPFIAVLALVITIHELGHFGAARLFGIRIDRFSLGFGKTLFSRTDRAGVEWRVAALPLGGYVKFAGDLDATGVPDKAGLDDLRQRIIAAEGPGAERAYFHFKPLWQRAVVVAAGPFANFVLAIVLFTIVASVAVAPFTQPVIGAVAADSPAAAAGFRPQDRILSMDGRQVRDFGDVQRYVMLRAGEPIRFEVERDGAAQVLTATPRRTLVPNAINGQQTPIGVLGMQSAEPPVWRRYTPGEAVAEGFTQTWVVLDSTLTYLRRVLTGRESGDQLSGPIGIAQASGAVAGAAAEGSESLGDGARRVFFSLLALAGLLSVGVGFLNLLPVPVLDGGHLLFYAYEAVARRPLAARIQEAGYRLGLALLVGLMLFATWNDLNNLNLFKFLGGLS